MAEAAVPMAAASPRRERLWPPPSVACPFGASLRGPPRGGASPPPAAAAMAIYCSNACGYIRQAFPGLWTGPLNFVTHYR